MDINAAREFLKNNPVFWSRLGFCYDPPLKNDEGKPLCFNENLEKYAKTHRSFTKAGVKIHSSILHSGWVGTDEYDYSLTDRVLDAVFRDNPDIYYIPRIKLNVPVDWCYENPEEVFVYWGGPTSAEEIKAVVGTPKHDYIGYDSEKGYAHAGDGGYKDTRPNVGGVIARQSFSSEKWLRDASVAFKKVIERIENSKYADRILGYHIGYGTSGETVVWGRISNKFGDYSKKNTEKFIKWGEAKYGSRKALAKAWGQSEDNLFIPAPDDRAGNTETLEKLMRSESNNQASIDYDIFMSEINANAIEHFAKIVRENAKDKLTGIFYGYFMHVDNSAYTGHLAIERLLNSPYVDFFAAPKSYYRCKGGEPGGELCSAQSVNMKKIWVDETDVRTYLAKGVEERSWESASPQDTICVLRREFSKNLAHDSGFWWMDLDGGWYDCDILMNEIANLTALNDRIRKKEHKSISDVLIIADENCINHMRTCGDVRKGFMEDFICEANMSGALCDVYRLSDFEALDISQYKLIVFAYCFKIDEKTKKLIDNKISKGITVMYNYSAGVIKDTFDMENIKDFTGFDVVKTCNYDCDGKIPRLAVSESGVEIISKSQNDEVVLASKTDSGIKRIINLIPYLKAEKIRQIAIDAGCQMYTDKAGNTVYGDNRFIGIFSSDGKNGEIKESN